MPNCATSKTDVGSICTVHLADLLVIVSGLNEQNLEGTRLAVERRRAARTDFAEKVLFVISPVPLGEEELKAQRLGVAAGRFARAMQTSRDLTDELLTVPYHPQIALSEGSFVFHHPQSPVAAAFRRIAEAIRDRNPADSVACVAALRGQREACRRWLERSEAAGRLPSRQHRLGDDDLRGVRDEPWFAELRSAARDEAGGDQRFQHATVVPTRQAGNR